MILQKIMNAYWDEVLSDVNKEENWHAYYLEAAFSTIKSIRICKPESWQNQERLGYWTRFSAKIWTGKPWDHEVNGISKQKGPPSLIIQASPCLGLSALHGTYRYVNLATVYLEGAQVFVYKNEKLRDMTVMIRKIKLGRKDDKK